MSDLHSLGLRRGAESFKRLAEQVGSISDDTCAMYTDDGPDTRDYVSMVSLAEASLRRALDHPDPLWRQGFLRALVDFLCINTDGCGVDPVSDEWDPIKNTAHAFARRGTHG